jgi:serine/threonine protein kinase
MNDVPLWREATRSPPDPREVQTQSMGSPGGPHPDDSTLPLAALERIERVCLAFEDAWKRGERPAVERYCADAPGPERSALLRHLLVLELDYRVRSGETPTAGDYRMRFPDCSALIADVFQSCSMAVGVSPPGAKPARFGDYELLEEIARGGMGVVYRARQIGLNRVVALKLILAGQLASRAEVERFRREAEVAAGLQHPNIVAIHEVGEQQGQHYFSMDYVEGQSLRDMVREHPLPAQRAAQYVKAIAEAIHYAHRQGTLHRDLKPANVLIDRADQPRITDFGLAKRIEGGAELTGTGEILGTPSYMPPEQAGSRGGRVGPASDVYAMGAILYELLTGRPPFQTSNPLNTLLQVLEREPIAPRRLNAHVPKDLETICLKAMEKNPDRRYRTAGDMAADLGRYLNGFAISARRVGPVGRMIRWVKRRRAVAASLFGVLVLGLAVAFFAYQLLIEKRQHAIDDAITAIFAGDYDKAEENIDKARRLGATPGWVYLLRGQLAWHRNETNEAKKHLEEAVKLLPRSPAARAMLAVAYWQDAKWDECEKALAVLDGLPAVTPEDHLFKGYAQATFDPGYGLVGIDEATFDPGHGLGSIDEAIRIRPDWIIAHALRAEARSWFAQDKTDAKVVEEALKDAQIVENMLPGKSIGPLVSLYANLVAATIYEKKGDPDNQKKKVLALAKAKKDAESLKAFPTSGWVVLNLYRYLEYIGKDQDAFQKMGLETRRVKGPWPATYYALGLYRRGQFKEALKVLDGLEEKDIGAFQEMMRMFILAELPEGGAMQLYRKTVKRYQGTTPLFLHTLLYRLGSKKEAVAAYKNVRLPEALASARSGSYAKLLAYNREAITAKQLLDAGKDSAYHQCNAHFFIAMKLLADGDRVAARDHFSECVKTRCFDFDAYDWSRAFLARMNQDPHWPRFLSPKEQATPDLSPPPSQIKIHIGRPAKM